MPASNPPYSTKLSARTGPDPASKSGAQRGSKSGKEPAKADNSIHFEPFHKRAYDMSYACLLIPRDPEHVLAGKVADFADKAVRATCSAFGWSLSFVQVRPEYIQWVVNASVGTPPTKCVHTIREQTSKGILEKFKELRDGTQYQDFWAPGYLVLVSAEPHPQNIIDEFIKLTRQQQGLRPPGSSGPFGR